MGVDLPGYIDEAERVTSIQSLTSLDIGRSRPLFFLLVLSLKGLTRLDFFTIIKFMPIILNPLLAVSAFFFTLEFLNNRWAASWSAFFTVSGFQVTVGMFAYYLTNMFGLTILFFSLGFLFKAIRKGDIRILIPACIFGGMLVFIHPWTFDQYYVPLFLVGFAMLFDLCMIRINFRREVKYLFALLASMSISEIVKFIFFQDSSGVSALETPASRIIDLGVVWSSLEYCFKIQYGGLLSNILLIFLMVIGVLTLERKSFQGRILWALLIMTFLVFISVDGSLKGRLIYNLPVGLLATLGYEYTLKQSIIRDLKTIYTVFIVISQLLYLFRSLNSLI
ncbi:MAG: hypothetical protein ACUVV4_06390 [Candidatus Bathyarchaeia archaeon]